MLRHRWHANPQQLGELADRTLAIDQLADDQQAVAVGERLEELAGAVRRLLHRSYTYIHDFEYTII